MPKKVLFGMKKMPLDMPIGTMNTVSSPKVPEMPKEAHIEAAHSGGYMVHTMPGKGGAHRNTHVAASMDEALDIAKGHMEGKTEPKNEKD